MTRTTRRILYSAAFAAFLLIGPPLVLMTAGWHWQGWGQGFTRSGVIVMSSTPNAEWSVNGKHIGQTPERLRNLVPGEYQLSLARNEFKTWTQAVAVEGGRATVIGPVYLVRSQPEVQTLQTQQPAGHWLADVDQRMLIWISPVATGFSLTVFYPEDIALTWTVPFAPTQSWLSPRGEIMVVQNDTQQAVIQLTTAEVWTSPRANTLSWSALSDHVWVGIQDGQAVVFDALEMTVHPLGPATSATFAFGDLWLTQETNGLTILLQQTYPNQALATRVLTREGSWQTLGIGLHALALRATHSHQTELWTAAPRPEQTGLALGVVDQLFWLDRRQPPIWQAGVDVLTLVDRQTNLLERTPTTYQYLGWASPRHVLAALTPEALLLQSVSARQGREQIISYPIPAGATIIPLPDQAQLLVAYPTGQLERWDWR